MGIIERKKTMDVYDFLNSANDLSNVVVTIFDCNAMEVVYDSRKTEEGECDPYDMGSLGDYEVESYDLFIDRDGRLCLELNTSIDGEDE
jgi:hypothetical protein